MTISAMEYLLSFNLSPILPFFTAALFLIFFGYYRSKSSNKTNLPPGSFGWPIIGETLGFVNQDHEKFIGDRMNKYSSKIFKTNILGEKTVVFCGVAGHKFVASNEEKLFVAWRPQSMQKLFRSSYQKVSSAVVPRKTEKQILGAPGFLRVDALVRYLPAMDSLVQEHFNRYWVGKQNVDAHHLSQLLVLTLSGRFFWGLEDQTRIQKLCKLMDTMMLALHVVDLNIPGTIFYRSMKAAEAARKEIQLLIKEKKEAMCNGVKMTDILSFMIAQPDPTTGNPMADHEIAGKSIGLVSAAFNSPAMTTAFIVKYLGEKPEIFNKVRKEQIEIASSKKDGEALNWEDIHKMKYSWSVALEVMRLIPPLQGTFREVTTDINYEGYTIPKGWKVYWTVSTTNKNTNYFPAPEEFDPSRFENEAPPPYTNIPFGSGPRICPGKDYARLQILTFMHHLVKRFKWDVINPNCKVLGGLNPVPTEGIYVRLHPCPP
jgi:cytochrome P450